MRYLDTPAHDTWHSPRVSLVVTRPSVPTAEVTSPGCRVLSVKFYWVWLLWLRSHRSLAGLREHYADRHSQSGGIYTELWDCYGSMTWHCVWRTEMFKWCSTKKYSIFRTFMEFCNCYSYRTNSRMSWLLRSWVHNCQTKNGLNPLKIAANVDLTRWKVAEIGRLYVVDRTLSRHSQFWRETTTWRDHGPRSGQ